MTCRSLAASAPIWMFGDLSPCNTFFKIVTADFQKSGPHCADNIKASWAVLDKLAQTGTCAIVQSCTGVMKYVNHSKQHYVRSKGTCIFVNVDVRVGKFTMLTGDF